MRIPEEHEVQNPKEIMEEDAVSSTSSSDDEASHWLSGGVVVVKTITITTTRRSLRNNCRCMVTVAGLIDIILT